MGLRYNPFTGSFDMTRSPGSYLDGEVAAYGDLPLDTAAAPLNSAWLVRGASGLWLLSRKPAGIYIRTATTGVRDADYTYAGTFPDVFSDANFVVYNDADSTKNLKLDASGLTTGTTRTLTVPDASGTLPLLETANTFSANQTLNGTNNVAPNQTAASGSSILTRDLGDARYLPKLRSVQYAFNSGWAAATTTGGSVTQAAFGLRVDGANGTNAGSATAYVFGERSGIGLNRGGNFASIDFANPLASNIFLTSRSFNFPANCNWAYIFGRTENAAAGLANMVKTGTTSSIGWVGLQCVAGDVTIIAADSTSAVASSSVIDTWVNGHNHKGYRIVVSGGAVSVTNSAGTLLGSLASGAPTTLKDYSNPCILVESSATTAQIGITVQHLSFDW